MRFNVATNFDNDLPGLIAPFGAVELFGKLPRDAIGGGRASYMLAPTSRRRLEEHVRAAHKSGLKFNYLINPSCMGNIEFTRSGQTAIRKLLDWLSEIEVDGLTLSVPYLLELVKTRYPNFSVKIGVYAKIDTPKKAEFFERLGADCITLPPLELNRDFPRLRAIREAVSCELQLIANSNCLLECPLAPYHAVGLSHASQSKSKGFLVDYCLMRCLVEKLSDPVNYIKSPWIRPEDIHHYTDIGDFSFKILERDAPTATLVSRVKAYHVQHFDGNLIDLIQCYGYRESRSTKQPKRRFLWELREFLRPAKVDPRRMLAFKELAKLQGMLYQRSYDESSFYIDNRALDGFMDRFVQESCTNLNCDSCRYCQSYAEKAVHIDDGFREQCLGLANQLLGDLATGRMWWSGGSTQ